MSDHDTLTILDRMNIHLTWYTQGLTSYQETLNEIHELWCMDYDPEYTVKMGDNEVILHGIPTSLIASLEPFWALQMTIVSEPEKIDAVAHMVTNAVADDRAIAPTFGRGDGELEANTIYYSAHYKKMLDWLGYTRHAAKTTVMGVPDTDIILLIDAHGRHAGAIAVLEVTR